MRVKTNPTYHIYCVKKKKKKGTRGKHGSSVSDSNHSSVLVHLNDCIENGNQYCENPQTLVKDLFFRQDKHAVRWNQQIYDESNDLALLHQKINKESEPHSYLASELRCLNSFRDFQDRMNKSSDYSKQTISPTRVIIRSLKHPTAPPRQCQKASTSENFKCYS